MMDLVSGQKDAQARVLNSDLAFALIIVTYGARLNLVQQVVCQALRHSSVKSVIIVDNDSASPVENLAIDLFDRDRIHILRQKTNTGSAGGYNTGLSYVQTLPNIDYVILLDDDLLIGEETVQALSQYIDNSPNCSALIVPRDDRPDQSASLESGRAPAIKPNSFHDFHIFDWQRSFRRHNRDASRSRTASKAVPVSYAPYAGMVLSEALVRSAELPDRNFYVYCDDYDYLMKLKAVGACPVLINTPPLKSIDRSWNQKSGLAPALFKKRAPAFRVYYSLRNRVTYERRYIVNNYIMYFANMMIFLFAGSLASLLDNGIQMRRLRLIATAIKDGWTGKLGRNDQTVRHYS